MRRLKIIVWLLAVAAVAFSAWHAPEQTYTLAQAFELLLEQNL